MNKNEKHIKEVIKRYGTVIDLVATPYVLIEIIRNYGGIFRDDPDGGLPPGGTPPPPPPGPDGFSIRNSDVVSQMVALTASVTALAALVEDVNAKLAGISLPQARIAKKAGKKTLKRKRG
jgi:hypothetical protein